MKKGWRSYGRRQCLCRQFLSYEGLLSSDQNFSRIDQKKSIGRCHELKASFCMGRCLSGISVMVNDTPVQNVGFVNAENVFYEHVFPLAQAEKAGE